MNRLFTFLVAWLCLFTGRAVAQSGEMCSTHQVETSYYALDADICQYAAVSPVSGKAMKVCRQGDKIYFHNIFCAEDIIQQDSLVVEGTIKGDTITIEMGQTIMTFGSYKMYLGLAVEGYDNYGNFQAAYTDDAPYKLSLDSKGNIESVDKDVFLVGYDSKNIPSYSLIRNMRLSPFTPDQTTVPEGLQVERYAYSYTKDYAEAVKVVNVCFDGNDCYIQGLCVDGAWIGGTVEGDSLIIPSNQYQGIVSSSFANFVAGKYVGENFVTGAKEYQPTDHFAFAISADRKTLTPAPDLTLMLTAGTSVLSLIENPTLTFFDEKPAVPAMPELIYAQVDATWGGIDFNLYCKDVDGNFINPANITWSILLDDEVFTFEPGLYSIEEPMSEFAYDYTDLNGGTEIYSGGAYHHVSVYGELYSTIGVEVYYTVDGVRQASGRLTYPESSDDTAIELTPVQEKEVVAESFSDMTGRRIEKPTQGLYIRTVKYADGSCRSFKLWKK